MDERKRPAEAEKRDEAEERVEDLDVSDEGSEGVKGGAYEFYVEIKGTKQGKLRGTGPS